MTRLNLTPAMERALIALWRRDKFGDDIAVARITLRALRNRGLTRFGRSEPDDGRGSHWQLTQAGNDLLAKEGKTAQIEADRAQLRKMLDQEPDLPCEAGGAYARWALLESATRHFDWYSRATIGAQELGTDEANARQAEALRAVLGDVPNLLAALRSELGGDWRCLYCGDRVQYGVECERSTCIEAQAAAERRMGMRSMTRKPPRAPQGEANAPKERWRNDQELLLGWLEERLAALPGPTVVLESADGTLGDFRVIARGDSRAMICGLLGIAPDAPLRTAIANAIDSEFYGREPHGGSALRGVEVAWCGVSPLVVFPNDCEGRWECGDVTT